MSAMNETQTVSQDFTRKMVIVVRKDLASWQSMNTVAHIAAYLSNKMREHFDTGEFFVTQDRHNHPRNTQYPIIVLSAKPGQMPNLMAKVRASGLLYLGYIEEMIETTDDAEIEQILAQKTDAEIVYLGIGVFGPNEEVAALTKKYSLWK